MSVSGAAAAATSVAAAAPPTTNNNQTDEKKQIAPPPTSSEKPLCLSCGLAHGKYEYPITCWIGSAPSAAPPASSSSSSNQTPSPPSSLNFDGEGGFCSPDPGAAALVFRKPLEIIRVVAENEQAGSRFAIETASEAVCVLKFGEETPLPDSTAEGASSFNKWDSPVWDFRPEITYRDVIRNLWLIRRIGDGYGGDDTTPELERETIWRGTDIFLSILTDPNIEINRHTLALVGIVSLMIAQTDVFEVYDYLLLISNWKEFVGEMYADDTNTTPGYKGCAMVKRMYQFILRYCFQYSPPIGQSDVIRQSMCQIHAIHHDLNPEKPSRHANTASVPPSKSEDAKEAAKRYGRLRWCIDAHYNFMHYPLDRESEWTAMARLNRLLRGRVQLQISITAMFIDDDASCDTKQPDLSLLKLGQILAAKLASNPVPCLSPPTSDNTPFWCVGVYCGDTFAPLSFPAPPVVNWKKELDWSLDGKEDGPQIHQITPEDGLPAIRDGPSPIHCAIKLQPVPPPLVNVTTLSFTSLSLDELDYVWFGRQGKYPDSDDAAEWCAACEASLTAKGMVFTKLLPPAIRVSVTAAASSASSSSSSSSSSMSAFLPLPPVMASTAFAASAATTNNPSYVGDVAAMTGSKEDDSYAEDPRNPSLVGAARQIINKRPFRQLLFSPSSRGDASSSSYKRLRGVALAPGVVVHQSMDAAQMPPPPPPSAPTDFHSFPLNGSLQIDGTFAIHGTIGTGGRLSVMRTPLHAITRPADPRYAPQRSKSKPRPPQPSILRGRFPPPLPLPTLS